jgi:hypothetical protein
LSDTIAMIGGPASRGALASAVCSAWRFVRLAASAEGAAINAASAAAAAIFENEGLRSASTRRAFVS